ncbi:MAG: hypothetical protein L6Q37_06345 [Bdellovibrionaceae bacterium]|nr:hypothetical protein [Pseudobdellovibrionaceae bacterium]
MKLSFTRLNGCIIFCLIAPNYHVMANTVNCLGTYTIDKASTSTHTSLESALNSAKKATPSVKYGDALNSIIAELNPDEQLVRLGLDNFNVAKNKESLALAAEKKSLVADHLKNSMPPEVAELSLKRLAKENILLGPIHKALFFEAISTQGFSWRELTILMTSSNPGDIPHKEKIASEMYSVLKKHLDSLPKDFKMLGNLQKSNLATNFQQSMRSSAINSMKDEVLIKNLELLL